MMRCAHRLLIGMMAFPALVSLAACAFLQQPKFGAAPVGERLESFRDSPNYTDGEFHNCIETPTLREGNSTFSILAGDLFRPAGNLRPAQPLPSVKTDLKALAVERDTIVWLGHSSFFVIFAGKRILIDPVLSPFAAPFSFANRAFEGTHGYDADDIPPIDVLLITHDHWDHLDYATLTALRDKVARAIVPLGVGAHLEHWGYASEKLSEADWYAKLTPGDGLAVHLVPARHYSGRWLTGNQTLWAGFVLESPTRRILFSGDTGYGPHFKELAQRFGGFDLAALDMGQYDPRWPYIHMTPEEAAQAAVELQAKTLLAAHIGRFSIARHAWNEPFARISAASRGLPYRLATPLIGEPLFVDDTAQRFTEWWQGGEGASPIAAAQP
jgi:L-ascorbate metabolism protein UlaG (beta-lactamase superfamily)